MQLSDLKAIVTGGASGMGRSFTLGLVQGGASVLVADLDEEKMAEVKAAAADLPGTVFTHRANVAEEDEVTAMVNTAHEQMGGLNCLINNAGIFRDGLLVKKDKETGAIKRMSLQNWKRGYRGGPDGSVPLHP